MLEILAKRNDGYHEIATVFQKISIYDSITASVIPDDKIIISLDPPVVASDNTNLAYKAADKLKTRLNVSDGISIQIHKNIPVGAGLGGGSSNAATTLLILRELFQLDVDDEFLKEMGKELGADVPFFLEEHSTAAAGGIGDRIDPLRLKETIWFLVVYPDLSISTAWAYGAYSSKHKLLTKKKKNTIISDFIDNLQHTTYVLHNDFEDVVIPAYPDIGYLKEKLVQAGAAAALMSGSGSSVFGLFKSKESAELARKYITCHKNYTSFIAHSL